MSAIAVGIRGQVSLDDAIDFSGTIAVGGTAQVLLPQQPRRTSFLIQNQSGTDTLAVYIGPPRGVATVTINTITAITVSGGSMGFTYAPKVVLLGGLTPGDYVNAPQNIAQAHCVMTGSAPNQSISSVVIDNPGSGYLTPPLVYFMNPATAVGTGGIPGAGQAQLGGGTGIPATTGTLNGFQLPPGFILSTTGMIIVPGSAVSIIGPTTGDPFGCSVTGLVS